MIIVTKNPIDDSDITIVSGVIETVKITKLKTPDAYKNTHKASLKIGDDWINVSAYKSTVDSLTTQGSNKNWVEVKEGQTVKFAISPRVYQGKTYYDVKRTNIKIVNSDSVNAGDAGSITSEASKINTEQSKQQSNTNTSVNLENAPKVDTKRFYGVLKSIASVRSPDGEAFLEFVELEKTTEIGEPQFFLTKTDLKLQEGCRVNFKYTTEDEKNIITEIVKVYDAIQTVSQKTKVVTKSKIQDAPFGSKERQMKVTIGNMFNVAVNAVGVSDLENTQQFACDLYAPANTLRDKLIGEYQETHSDNDIGAKLGDALKAAALVEKEVGALIVKAEEILKVQIELEKMIFNKGTLNKEEKQMEISQGLFSNSPEVVDHKGSILETGEDPINNSFDDQIPF